MAVSDYNASASLNTTISGISIAEGSPRANVNDAIRQMMADVKTFSLTADPNKGLANNGVGSSVLQALTTGDRNTGLGYYALKADTTGNENTGVGYLALTAVIGGTDPVGSYNTAFGSYALASLTTGYKNTAVGRASSDNLTTGNQNVACGYGSFHWATTAVNCTAIGFEAVHGGSAGPITAQGITGVGFRALYECLGDFNTAVGTSAAASLTSGARNTAIGVNALNTQLTANDCVGLGYGAGLTNTGSGNIFLGAGADANTGLSNVTVIATGLTATLSNTLILGNQQTVLPGGATAGDIGSTSKPWGFGIYSKAVAAHSATAIPAGGTAGAGFLLSSTSNFGIFFGSGAPTLSAAKGSLYLRSDGSSTSTRMYVNTDGGTTWTNVVTAA